jgi:hypothetical protein
MRYMFEYIYETAKDSIHILSEPFKLEMTKKTPNDLRKSYVPMPDKDFMIQSRDTPDGILFVTMISTVFGIRPNFKFSQVQISFTNQSADLVCAAN